MKNREKYVDFLLKCAANNTVSFGVDKITGEPKVCSSSSAMDEIKCTNCKFGTTFCGEKTRNEWLDEECDPWSEFRDLKKGDIILVNKNGFWHPYVFDCFIGNKLMYGSCMNDNGNIPCAFMFEGYPNFVRRVK